MVKPWTKWISQKILFRGFIHDPDVYKFHTTSRPFNPSNFIGIPGTWSGGSVGVVTFSKERRTFGSIVSIDNVCTYKWRLWMSVPYSTLVLPSSIRVLFISHNHHRSNIFLEFNTESGHSWLLLRSSKRDPENERSRSRERYQFQGFRVEERSSLRKTFLSRF